MANARADRDYPGVLTPSLPAQIRRLFETDQGRSLRSQTGQERCHPAGAADGLLLLSTLWLHVRWRAALGIGGRHTAATGRKRAGGTLRGRLAFVLVRGASTPVDGLRCAQSIEVELGLSTCRRGVSGDAERGEYKAHVRSSREVDIFQPGARAFVPRGVVGTND